MGVQLIYFKMLLLNDVQRINHQRLIRKNWVSPSCLECLRIWEQLAPSLFSLLLIHLVHDPSERSPWGPKKYEPTHRDRHFLSAAILPLRTLPSSAKAFKKLGFASSPAFHPLSLALHRPMIVYIFTVTHWCIQSAWASDRNEAWCEAAGNPTPISHSACS